MLSVGTPKKMSNEGRVLFLIEHLRPQAPPQVGTPNAAPAENQGFSPGDPDFQPHPEIRDFVTGTPIYPVPIGFNAFLFRYDVKYGGVGVC